MAQEAETRDDTAIKAAIRCFTVDAEDGKPNGPTEQAIVDLEAALGRWNIEAARAAAASLCEALAADTKALREAASAYFGEDFGKPAADTPPEVPANITVAWGPQRVRFTGDNEGTPSDPEGYAGDWTLITEDGKALCYVDRLGWDDVGDAFSGCIFLAAFIGERARADQLEKGATSRGHLINEAASLGMKAVLAREAAERMPTRTTEERVARVDATNLASSLKARADEAWQRARAAVEAHHKSEVRDG